MKGVLADITERKLTAEALQESEEKYKDLFSNIPVGLFWTRVSDGKLLDCNDNFAGLVGYKNSKECLSQFVASEHHVDPAARKRVLGEIRDNGEVGNFEAQITRKDGSTAWVSYSVRIYPERNIIQGAVVDVTDRKRAEEALQESHDVLARRTQSLEAVNKELEAFSYSVSHDLRGPLRHMEGYSRVLLTDHVDQLDDEGKACLQRVVASSSRMSRLIDDLLRLSSLTRGELEIESVDLSSIAREIARRLQETKPERNVKFSFPSRVVAHGDPRLLQVVLENLIGNAWKFTSRKRRAEIGFGVKKVNGSKTYYVRDNGAGFYAAEAGKLFVPFVRLHTDTEFDGSGIGLATVQRIVHRHGGRVWAEGRRGKGAVFHFTL